MLSDTIGNPKHGGNGVIHEVFFYFFSFFLIFRIMLKRCHKQLTQMTRLHSASVHPHNVPLREERRPVCTWEGTGTDGCIRRRRVVYLGPRRLVRAPTAKEEKNKDNTVRNCTRMSEVGQRRLSYCVHPFHFRACGIGNAHGSHCTGFRCSPSALAGAGLWLGQSMKAASRSLFARLR